MSQRIDFIISNIDSSSIGVADVGTDHGFVPIGLAKSGFGGNIIASDINMLPLKKAMKNAEVEGVSGKIDFVLSDGLADINCSLIDTVIISGMGGELICRILDCCEWILDNRFKLILQPASRSEVLLYWLDNNGFSINNDCFIEEKGRRFRVITSSFDNGRSRVCDAELYCGVSRFCSNTPEYMEALSSFSIVLNNIISGLHRSETCKREELAYYGKLLDEVNNIMTEVDNGSKA